MDTFTLKITPPRGMPFELVLEKDSQSGGRWKAVGGPMSGRSGQWRSKVSLQPTPQTGILCENLYPLANELFLNISSGLPVVGQSGKGELRPGDAAIKWEVVPTAARVGHNYDDLHNYGGHNYGGLHGYQSLRNLIKKTF